MFRSFLSTQPFSLGGRMYTSNLVCPKWIHLHFSLPASGFTDSADIYYHHLYICSSQTPGRHLLTFSLSLNSHIQSITSTHWFCGPNISYTYPLLPILTSIKATIIISDLNHANSTPTDLNTINFSILVFPKVDSIFQRTGKMIGV